MLYLETPIMVDELQTKDNLKKVAVKVDADTWVWKNHDDPLPTQKVGLIGPEGYSPIRHCRWFWGKAIDSVEKMIELVNNQYVRIQKNDTVRYWARGFALTGMKGTPYATLACNFGDANSVPVDSKKRPFKNLRNIVDNDSLVLVDLVENSNNKVIITELSFEKLQEAMHYGMDVRFGTNLELLSKPV